MAKFKITHEEINQAYDDAMKASSELEGQNPMRESIEKVVQLAESMKKTERPQQ